MKLTTISIDSSEEKIGNIGDYLSERDIKNPQVVKMVNKRFAYLVNKYKNILMFQDDGQPMGDIALVQFRIDEKLIPNKLLCIYLVGKTHIDYVEVYDRRTKKHHVIFHTYDLRGIKEATLYEVVSSLL